MIGLALNGHAAANAALSEIGGGIAAAIPQVLDQASETFKSFWQLHLSGPASKGKLGVHTGALRASIQIQKDGTVRRVGTPLPYARVHEEGLPIEAKRAPYLWFKVGKAGDWGWVKVKRVKMPKRPHFAPAVQDAKPIIIDLLDGKMVQAVNRASAKTAAIQDEQWSRMGEIATLGGTGRRTYQLTS